MKVHIESYNPKWLEEFSVAKGLLQQALRDVPTVSIQHVGSTSVQGLPAKPVIDIDVIVERQHVRAARNALSAAGYTDMGDMNIPGRYAFRQPGITTAAGLEYNQAMATDPPGVTKETPLGLRRNTYVLEQGCTALRNHLDVKRILEADGSLRTEYAELKWKLASRDDYENIGQYVTAKNDILQKILAKAGWSQEDLDELRRINS